MRNAAEEAKKIIVFYPVPGYRRDRDVMHDKMMEVYDAFGFPDYFKREISGARVLTFLMTEFMSLKARVDAKGLRSTVIWIDLIIDNLERLTDKKFCDESKVGKLRELIPKNIWFNACPASNTEVQRLRLEADPA